MLEYQDWECAKHSYSDIFFSTFASAWCHWEQMTLHPGHIALFMSAEAPPTLSEPVGKTGNNFCDADLVKKRAETHWEEHILYILSSLPSSLFYTTSPFPPSVKASAKTSASQAVQSVQTSVKYLWVWFYPNPPCSPIVPPDENMEIFAQVYPKANKQTKPQSKKVFLLCGFCGGTPRQDPQWHQTVGKGFANQLVQMATLKRAILMRSR